MLLLYLIGVILLVGLDQLSKWAVLSYVKPYDTVPLWQNVFHFTYCENRGAAFGILQNRFGFFFVVTLLLVLAVTIFMFQKRQHSFCMTAGLTLLVGGALGNFIDRFFRGYVIDFLDFTLINFPIFNVADCFVVCGAALLIYFLLRGGQIPFSAKK